MGKIIDYTVVAEVSIAKLEDTVLILTKAGYTPVGHAAVGLNEHYMQTMIKYREEVEIHETEKIQNKK